VDSKTLAAGDDVDAEVDGEGPDDVGGFGEVRIPGEEAVASAVGVRVGLAPMQAAIATAIPTSPRPRDTAVTFELLLRAAESECMVTIVTLESRRETVLRTRALQGLPKSSIRSP